MSAVAQSAAKNTNSKKEVSKMTVQSAITSARLGATIYLQHKQTSLQHMLIYRSFPSCWLLDGNLVSYAVVKAVLAESDISLTPFPISTPEPTSPPRTESMPSPLLPPEFTEKLDKKIAQAVADAAFKCKIDQIGDIRSVVSQLCQEAFFLGQQDSNRFLHNSEEVKEKVMRTLQHVSREEAKKIMQEIQVNNA
jgi:hypothetical protein